MMTQVSKSRATQSDLENPSGWAVVRIGDVYDLSYGKGLSRSARNPIGKYPVYGANGIVGHHDSYLIDGPALIIGRKGTAGAVWFSSGPCWPIDTTYYVPDSDHIHIRFSLYLFTSLRLHRFDRSTAIPGLNRNDVYELAIHLPPLAEQHRIVARVDELFSTLDNGIESLKKARARLDDKALRHAILKKALSGQLVAQDPNDEPASVLLERIRAEREHTERRRAHRKAGKRRTARQQDGR